MCKVRKREESRMKVKFLFGRVNGSIIHRVREHWRRNKFEGKDDKLGYGCSGAIGPCVV